MAERRFWSSGIPKTEENVIRIKTDKELEEYIRQPDLIRWHHMVIALGMLGRACFNVSVIIYNFVDIPPRDASKKYNLSIIAVSWTEFLIIVCLIVWLIWNIYKKDWRDIRRCVRSLGWFSAFIYLRYFNPTFLFVQSQYLYKTEWGKDRISGWKRNVMSVLFGLPVIIVLVGLAPLSLLIKVSQLHFTVRLGALEWTWKNWVDFLAFLNQIAFLASSDSVGQLTTHIWQVKSVGSDWVQCKEEMRALFQWTGNCFWDEHGYNGALYYIQFSTKSYLKLIFFAPSETHHNYEISQTESGRKQKQSNYINRLKTITGGKRQALIPELTPTGRKRPNDNIRGRARSNSEMARVENEVHKWLITENLGCYADKFVTDGIVTLRALANLSREEMTELGVAEEHQNIILGKIGDTLTDATIRTLRSDIAVTPPRTPNSGPVSPGSARARPPPSRQSLSSRRAPSPPRRAPRGPHASPRAPAPSHLSPPKRQEVELKTRSPPPPSRSNISPTARGGYGGGNSSRVRPTRVVGPINSRYRASHLFNSDTTVSSSQSSISMKTSQRIGQANVTTV